MCCMVGADPRELAGQLWIAREHSVVQREHGGFGTDDGDQRIRGGGGARLRRRRPVVRHHGGNHAGGLRATRMSLMIAWSTRCLSARCGSDSRTSNPASVRIFAASSR